MAQAHEETFIEKELVPLPGSARLLLRNIGYLAGSQVITWTASLLYTVIVARAIGPEGNGELNTGAAFLGILTTMVGFGSATYLVKEIAADPPRARRLVASALTVELLALPAAAAAMTAYLIIDHFSREMTIVFILFGLGLLPAVWSQTLQAALQGIQRMGVIAACGALTSLVCDAVIVLLVLLGHRNVILIAAVLLAAQCAAMALTIAVYRRHFPARWRRIRLPELGGIVRGSLPFLATQVVFTLYVAADTLILATLSSQTEVGWYGAVGRLFASLLVVSTILSTAWLPRLAAHARHDPAALGREVRMVVRLALVSAVPLAAGGSLVASRLVVALWGHAYTGAGAPMSVMLLSLPATSICTILYQLLVARGRAATWAWVMTIALLLNVVANVALVLWFRAEGRSTALAAALCLNFTEAGMAVVAVWLSRHELGLPMLWYALRTLAAAVLMAAVVLVVAHLPLAVVITIGALVFCPLALAFRLVTREELAAGRLVVTRLVRR